MNLKLIDGTLYFDSSEARFDKDGKIRVHLDLGLDLRKYKLYISVNQEPFHEVGKYFDLGTDQLNSGRVQIALKVLERSTRKSKMYKSDPTDVRNVVLFGKGLRELLPQTFTDSIDRVKSLEKQLKEFRKDIYTLSNAIIELGKKGELL